MKKVVAELQARGLADSPDGDVTLPPLDVVAVFHQPDTRQPTGSRRGRKGKGEHFYAQVSQTYVAEAEKGTRRGILEAIRKRHRLANIDQARAAVYRARQMGLLGGRQAGKVSGVLSEKAKAVLATRPPKKKRSTAPRRRAAGQSSR